MRLARRVAVPVAVMLVVLVGLVWVFQRRLIYLPAGAPPPVAEVLAGGEEVDLSTADDLELAAWFLPAGPTGVVVLPGNAGNRARRAPLARALADVGLSVLLVDYRGYGGNPGRPTEEGVAADAEAAASWLQARPEVDRVVYFGESLGAAVAAELAVRRPPAALVLRSPFTSLLDVARVHYGPVPAWLLWDRFATIDRIGLVDTPVLVIAADEDAVVPPAQSRRVHAAAPAPKRFVTVTGTGHNHPDLLDGPRLIETVTSFLHEHDVLPDEPAPSTPAPR